VHSPLPIFPLCLLQQVDQPAAGDDVVPQGVVGGAAGAVGAVGVVGAVGPVAAVGAMGGLAPTSLQLANQRFTQVRD
jgi:hypothetical protein